MLNITIEQIAPYTFEVSPGAGVYITVQNGKVVSSNLKESSETYAALFNYWKKNVKL